MARRVVPPDRPLAGLRLRRYPDQRGVRADRSPLSVRSGIRSPADQTSHSGPAGAAQSGQDQLGLGEGVWSGGVLRVGEISEGIAEG